MIRVGRDDGATGKALWGSSPAQHLSPDDEWRTTVVPPSTALDALWRARRAWERIYPQLVLFPLDAADSEPPPAVGRT